MAFGWKTEYEKRIPAEGMTNWEIFSVAEAACKELEWEYLVASETKFTATTPIHWTLNEEIITIVPENDEIIFKSQSESLELYEAGRNKKNLEEHLLPVFKTMRVKLAGEKLQQAAETLKKETLNVLQSGNRVAGEKITFWFEDHEVTFFLLLVNIIVFVLMAARGVDIHNPSPVDITNWGGNVREYVAVGEWWRLITNLFVHIGLKMFIANMIGLYFLGLMVETILGKVKFLIGYLTTGALGSLISIYYVGEGVTAGASPAISGLYGILLAFGITGYVNKKFNKLWFAGFLAYLIFIFWTGSNESVDNASNLGGWIAGVVVGFLFYFFHFKRNVARAGGTRISIEIMLIAALLIFLYIRSGKDDSLRFEKAVMKLNQIELKAMGQLQQLQNAESDKEAAVILKNEALPLWRNFQKQINKTDKYNLDDQFKKKRKLLHDYAELRIRQNELMYKSITEETDKYNQEIEEVADKIEKIIDQLEL